MNTKRPASPQLISNPLIKKRNLTWSLTTPSSPPPPPPVPDPGDQDQARDISTAALESGATTHPDPLSIFPQTLQKHTLTSQSTLPVKDYTTLYTSNANSPHGAHFVIHQHDHPVAGTHYDLRLQINETSSASWAIMYGLPGDGNSVRLNRNATETRVHCLWNHLIETASAQTGSLLIWDTGTYSILPRRSKHAPRADPNSQQASSPDSLPSKTQQELLHEAFQNRKIRIQLHGSKLPRRYILNLRLTKDEDAAGRKKNPAKRRRKSRYSKSTKIAPETSSESDGNEEEDEDDVNIVPKGQESNPQISAMDKELREMEDDEIRRNNAYSGAENTIGSVHQRRWYLSLDRESVGYKKGTRGRWYFDAADWDDDNEIERSEEGSSPRSPRRESRDELRLSYPFYVRGVEDERSVVTGRRGVDVLHDEGVQAYTGRKGWKPVLN